MLRWAGKGTGSGSQQSLSRRSKGTPDNFGVTFRRRGAQVPRASNGGSVGRVRVRKTPTSRVTAAPVSEPASSASSWQRPSLAPVSPSSCGSHSEPARNAGSLSANTCRRRARAGEVVLPLVGRRSERGARLLVVDRVLVVTASVVLFVFVAVVVGLAELLLVDAFVRSLDDSAVDAVGWGLAALALPTLGVSVWAWSRRRADAPLLTGQRVAAAVLFGTLGLGVVVVVSSLINT
jgi:hypothetical protein